MIGSLLYIVICVDRNVPSPLCPIPGCLRKRVNSKEELISRVWKINEILRGRVGKLRRITNRSRQFQLEFSRELIRDIVLIACLFIPFFSM